MLGGAAQRSPQLGMWCCAPARRSARSGSCSDTPSTSPRWRSGFCAGGIAGPSTGRRALRPAARTEVPSRFFCRDPPRFPRDLVRHFPRTGRASSVFTIGSYAALRRRSTRLSLLLPDPLLGPDRSLPALRTGLEGAPQRGGFLEDLDGAVHRIFQGFLYKFIIAALLKTYWLDRWRDAAAFGRLSSYMYAYSLYLFFDFAGYSAFAIGVSRLFGIHDARRTSTGRSSRGTSATSGTAGT